MMIGYSGCSLNLAGKSEQAGPKSLPGGQPGLWLTCRRGHKQAGFMLKNTGLQGEAALDFQLMARLSLRISTSEK